MAEVVSCSLCGHPTRKHGSGGCSMGGRHDTCWCTETPESIAASAPVDLGPVDFRLPPPRPGDEDLVPDPDPHNEDLVDERGDAEKTFDVEQAAAEGADARAEEAAVATELSESSTVEELLAATDRLDHPRIAKQAQRVRQDVEVLRELVEGHEKRTKAEADVAEARRLLAEAEANLRQTVGIQPGRTKAASRGERAAELRRIREWASGQGMEVADRGQLSRAVLDAYAAAHPEVADG